MWDAVGRRQELLFRSTLSFQPFEACTSSLRGTSVCQYHSADVFSMSFSGHSLDRSKSRATAASSGKESQSSAVWRPTFFCLFWFWLLLASFDTSTHFFCGKRKQTFYSHPPFLCQVIWDLCWAYLRLTHFSCLFSRLFLPLNTICLCKTLPSYVMDT